MLFSHKLQQESWNVLRNVGWHIGDLFRVKDVGSAKTGKTEHFLAEAAEGSLVSYGTKNIMVPGELKKNKGKIISASNCVSSSNKF